MAFWSRTLLITNNGFDAAVKGASYQLLLPEKKLLVFISS
jgi:hypothetical protein